MSTCLMWSACASKPQGVLTLRAICKYTGVASTTVSMKNERSLRSSGD